MILDARRTYFRYDHSEGLRGGTHRTLFHVSPAKIIPSRKAPQELAWRNSGFIDEIIRRSQADRDEEAKDASDEEAKDPSAEDASSESDGVVSSDSDDSDAVPREDRVPRVPTQAARQIIEARNQYARSLPVSRVFPMISIAPESEISDDNVWQIANKLRWVDRDEIERSLQYIANVLSLDDCIAFYRGGLRLAMKLEPAFIDNPAFSALGGAEKKDLLFHIVGKGLHFYTFVLQCPEVALYLFENKWQPLYAWILNRANSRGE